MTENEAIALIKDADIDSAIPQKWADLGCGSGLFIRALSYLLPEESKILAVDKNTQNIEHSSIKSGVELQFLQADMVKEKLPIKGFDGILMANSFHFVKEKKNFIRDLESQLQKRGHYIIIEYDIDTANRWIPYPITFDKLKDVFNDEGYSKIRKIGTRPSKYGFKKMYASEIKP